MDQFFSHSLSNNEIPVISGCSLDLSGIISFYCSETTRTVSVYGQYENLIRTILEPNPSLVLPNLSIIKKRAIDFLTRTQSSSTPFSSHSSFDTEIKFNYFLNQIVSLQLNQLRENVFKPLFDLIKEDKSSKVIFANKDQSLEALVGRGWSVKRLSREVEIDEIRHKNGKIVKPQPVYFT